jgi:hypothetical protein
MLRAQAELIDALAAQKAELDDPAITVQALVEMKRRGEAAVQVARGIALTAERELGRCLIEMELASGDGGQVNQMRLFP